MAVVPTQEEIAKLQLKTDKAIEKKVESQAEENKEFILPDGGGSGVIPEDVWKNLPGNKITDPEATE